MFKNYNVEEFKEHVLTATSNLDLDSNLLTYKNNSELAEPIGLLLDLVKSKIDHLKEGETIDRDLLIIDVMDTLLSTTDSATTKVFEKILTLSSVFKTTVADCKDKLLGITKKVDNLIGESYARYADAFNGDALAFEKFIFSRKCEETGEDLSRLNIFGGTGMNSGDLVNSKSARLKEDGSVSDDLRPIDILNMFLFTTDSATTEVFEKVFDLSPEFKTSVDECKDKLLEVTKEVDNLVDESCDKSTKSSHRDMLDYNKFIFSRKCTDLDKDLALLYTLGGFNIDVTSTPKELLSKFDLDFINNPNISDIDKIDRVTGFIKTKSGYFLKRLSSNKREIKEIEKVNGVVINTFGNSDHNDIIDRLFVRCNEYNDIPLVIDHTLDEIAGMAIDPTGLITYQDNFKKLSSSGLKINPRFATIIDEYLEINRYKLLISLLKIKLFSENESGKYLFFGDTCINKKVMIDNNITDGEICKYALYIKFKYNGALGEHGKLEDYLRNKPKLNKFIEDSAGTIRSKYSKFLADEKKRLDKDVYQKFITEYSQVLKTNGGELQKAVERLYGMVDTVFEDNLYIAFVLCEYPDNLLMLDYTRGLLKNAAYAKEHITHFKGSGQEYEDFVNDQLLKINLKTAKDLLKSILLLHTYNNKSI